MKEHETQHQPENTINTRAWAWFFGVLIAAGAVAGMVYWWQETSASTQEMRQRVDELQQKVNTLEQRLEQAPPPETKTRP